LVRGDSEDTYEKNYFHSLKQGLFLEHGSSDVAMQLEKKDQRCLWDSLTGSNAPAFAKINQKLRKMPAKRIPVRLVLKGGPVLQPPCIADAGDGKRTTLGEFVSKHVAVSDGALRVVCHGVPLSLDAPLLELWFALSFPDHFLYLVVLSESAA
jgi:hypothetical protein